MSYILWLGLVGGLLALVAGGTGSVLPGALLGALTGWVLGLHDRVRKLERALARLTVEASASSPAPSAAVEPPTVVDAVTEAAIATTGAPAGAPAGAAQPSPPGSAAATTAWERAPGEDRDDTGDMPLPELELPDLPPSGQPSESPTWQRALRSFFTDGNLVVRLGLLVLFFGVAFLLKYAAEHSLLPIELRLAGSALGGIALAGTGWWLRERRRTFALLLQGGGIGIFYLVVYGAVALYGLLPPPLALLLMVALVGLLVALALWQDAQSLAAFAITGGFLAPVLASSGSGSHVMLFSYYALLNVVVLALAWFRAWRPLNLLGFVFTFVIGTLWGVLQYHPQHYATTQPFLIFFFLLYVSVAVLFALRQPLSLRGYVDASLVFGVPIVGFALQAALVHRIEYGMAFSALVLGGFYLILARVLWQRRIEGMRLFTEALLALGVIFATLAIPLALDGRWTAAAWALEGAAMLWIGQRQRRLPVRLFGMALQLFAGLAFVLAHGYPADALPLFNSAALGIILIALAALFSAWVMQREPDTLRLFERSLHGAWMGWGLFWWLAGGFREIGFHLATAHKGAASLLFVALSTAVLLALWRRLSWPALRWPLLGALPLIWLMVVPEGGRAPWLWGLGLLAWPVIFIVQYRLLSGLQDTVPAWGIRLSHAATLWLLLWLLGHDAWMWVGTWLGGDSAWAWAAPALPALLALGLLPGWAPRLPLGRWSATYQGEGLLPVALVLGLWLLGASSHPADAAPLPWLPLLNPLELSQLLGLLAMALWLRHAQTRELFARLALAPAVTWALWGTLAFVLLNTVLAHVIHHWAGVAWRADALFASGRLQATLSVVWTLVALALGWWATRHQWRPLWFVAAGLIGVVVLKLFVIDLADSGTIERIVSFIAVGALMLLMGYVAPLPPRSARVDDDVDAAQRHSI